MSQIIHNISNPNDNLGDQLRSAFNNQNTMNSELYENKVDKIEGKGLSSNDFTNTLKEKLDSIEEGAQVNVQSDVSESNPASSAYILNFPTRLSDFENDLGGALSNRVIKILDELSPYILTQSDGDKYLVLKSDFNIEIPIELNDNTEFIGVNQSGYERQIFSDSGVEIIGNSKINDGCFFTIKKIEIDGDEKWFVNSIEKVNIKSDENLILANRKGDTLYNIIDKYTGEKIVLQKTNDSNTADSVIYFQLGSEKFKRVNSEWINVKWFGAKGDGESDDSSPIRTAISKMPLNGGKLYFPPGTYIHGDGTNPSYPLPYSGSVDIGVDISFYFENYINFEVKGYGAIIKSHPNNSCIKRNRIFHFRKCENGLISGLEIDGSIETREPSGGDPGGFNNQNNCLFDTCKNIKVLYVISNKSVMDGFTIASERLFEGFNDWSEDIVFQGCTANYNYRQGLSVINAKRPKIYNSEFSYTGTIFGTSPMAGIDFEEAYNTLFGRGQKQALVSGCKFVDNVGTGVSLHYGTSESVVEKSYFHNNNLFIPNDVDGLTANNIIINNNFFNGSIDVDGGGEYIANNVLKGDGKKQFSIFVNDSNNQFEALKSKRQIIEKNYVELLTNPSVLTGEYGSVFLFSNSAKYVNNYHKNVKSNTYIFNNNLGKKQIIKNNVWKNFGLETSGTIGGFNLVDTNIWENNEIDKVYNFINTNQFSQMNIKEKSIDKNLISKTFIIPTMLANKCIDIVLPVQSLTYNFDVKIKSNSVFFSYDAIGSREDFFNSLNTKRKLKNVIGSVLNGFDVSDIITKEGRKVITLKTKSDSSQSIGVLVELFYYSKHVNPDDIYLSKVYNTSELSGQVFRNIYHGELSGTTANRPLTLGYTEIEIGASYFDTTIGKPIWYNGTNWIDSTGTTV